MFENHIREASEISTEIGRKLMALGVDPSDTPAMMELARMSLDPSKVSESIHAAEHGERHSLLLAELFGLANLMLKTMEESALQDGVIVSGNEAWKSFARAMHAVKGDLPRTKPGA